MLTNYDFEFEDVVRSHRGRPSATAQPSEACHIYRLSVLIFLNLADFLSEAALMVKVQ